MLTIISLIIVLVLALLTFIERERKRRAKHRAVIRTQLLNIRLMQYSSKAPVFAAARER